MSHITDINEAYPPPLELSSTHRNKSCHTYMNKSSHKFSIFVRKKQTIFSELSHVTTMHTCANESWHAFK